MEKVKILLGSSGYGKTHDLYRRVIDAACKDMARNFYIVVPEQNSLQVEKDIVSLHPNHGMFNITVLTFGRMTFRIFDELGIELKENIDDTGKNLIIRRIIDDVADKLRIVKASRKPGLISEIKSFISELKQYGITIERLDEIISNEGLGDRLRQKLQDIREIYNAFELYISDKYMTAEDRPEAMLSVMDRSHYFDNAVVFFDNFTGFTPVQYRIIEKIISSADSLFFYATLHEDERYNLIKGDEELFFMSKDMIGRIGNICDSMHIGMSVENIQTDFSQYRYRDSEELAFLEKNIFRYNKEKYHKEVKDIEIKCLDTPLEEIQCLASGIISKVRDLNLRYRDIGVILGDVEEYAPDIIRVFSESGIPFFIDSKRSIIGNPMVENIRALLEIAQSNYSYESVFRFLKNGLSDMQETEVDILENYVLAYNIRYKNIWAGKFVREYPGKKTELVTVNRIRESFYSGTEKVISVLMNSESTVSQCVKAIYEYIENADMFGRMEGYAQMLENEHPGDMFYYAKAAEYRKTYNAVISFMDQIDALLGDECIEIREFAAIMDSGFETVKVGVIPVSTDCVTIGDIERTRLEHIKILYMLGVNEGIIPRRAENGGILSETERSLLDECEVMLAPTSERKAFIQNYYLYLHMTKPSNSLILSYHKINNAGRESNPSRIISVIKKLYPEIKIIRSEDLKPSDRVTNPSNSRHLLTDNKNITDMGGLFMYFLTHEPYCNDIKRMLEIYAVTGETDSLTGKVAEELYAELGKGSISRLEKFAGCAFSHFAGYGLELCERKIYELNSMEMGNIFHKSIELISLELRKNNRTMGDLSIEDCKMLVPEYVKRAMQSDTSTFFVDNYTNQYMFKRITDMVVKTVWALGEQLRHGSFTPEDFEWKFSDKYKDMPIMGKVDRYDLVTDQDEIFVKVIDYKSSVRTLDLNEIYAGLKLQLMLYLGEVVSRVEKENADKKVIGAAAFYNIIDNPIVDEGDGTEKDILKAMRPSGIMAIEGVGYMDDWEKGSSSVIPASISGGSVKMGSTVFSKDQLKCLTEFAKEKMYELNCEIEKGVVAAEPYEGSCDYCPYNSVCGFDSSVTDYRKVDRVSDNKDLWKMFGFGKGGEADGMDN